MSKVWPKHLLSGQLNLFYLALGFFTRLPVPDSVDFSQTQLNQASRYFPLVGWLVGLISALVLLVSSSLLPVTIAVVLAMLGGVLLSGGFHEDGLADSCDGLGGGWSPEQKLAIMKDSRLGSYGALGLWFALSLKWLLLSEISQLSLSQGVIALLVAHPLSRLLSTLLIGHLPYVGLADGSKSKPLAEQQSAADQWIAVVCGASAVLLVPGQAGLILPALMLLGWAAKVFLQRQIGGFTGDALGGVQQISELLIYLLLLASYHQGAAL